MRIYRLQRQEGVAIVTALLITALASAIVATVFARMNVQIQLADNAGSRIKNLIAVQEVRDWQRKVLRDDARSSGIDFLGQNWADPANTDSLKKYLSIREGEGRLNVSASTSDMQARYNLNNLAMRTVVNLDELEVLKRLLLTLNLSASLAPVIVGKIVAAQTPLPASQSKVTRKAGRPVLPMRYAEDLHSLPGFTPEIVAKRAPHVTLLPIADTLLPVNANTASPEVLAARLRGLSLAEAQALVAQRQKAPFVDLHHFAAMLEKLFAGRKFPDATQLSVSSQYFLLESRVEIGRAEYRYASLLQRQANRYDDQILWSRAVQ